MKNETCFYALVHRKILIAKQGYVQPGQVRAQQ